VIALIYAFLGGVWSLHQCSPSVLIANILVLIGLERQLRIFKANPGIAFVFRNGILVRSCSVVFSALFDANCWSLVALVFNRSFSLREHLLLHIAAAIPFFISRFVFLFWTGRTVIRSFFI
jgi:hypothetical protein